MKRFLCAIFVILLLSHNVGESQTKTDTSRESDPPAPTVIEEQKTTDESPQPHQEQSNVEDETVIGDQGPPLVERVKKLATKTNWALFISFLATIFAGLSWRAAAKGYTVAKNTLTETKKSTRLDMQPYLSCESVTVIPIVMAEENRIVYNVSLIIKNNGKTPAYIESTKDTSFGTCIASQQLLNAKPVPVSEGVRVYIAPDKPEQINIASAYTFDNFIDNGSWDGLSLSGEITLLYWDNFTPQEKYRSISFSFRWDNTSRRIAKDDSATRLGRTTELRLEDRAKHQG